MNPQDIKDAILQITRGVQKLLEDGEVLSEELMVQTTQTLKMLLERYDEAEAQQGNVEGLTPTPQEPIRLARDMPSSNVHSFGYDDNTGRLLVRFQGDFPNQNGPIYAYEGVPQPIFQMFKQGAIPAKTNGQNKWGKWWVGKTPSLGASLNALIKNGGYQYTRLT